MAQPKVHNIDIPFVMPSIHLLRCEKCGSSQIEIIGVKGMAAKNLGNIAAATTAGVLGGAVGGAIYGAVKGSADSKKPAMPLATIRFQCTACKEKFEAEPHGTEAADVLEAPFTITFTRKGIFGDDPYYLFLNGIQVSVIPTLTNTFVFPTSVRRNTLILIGALGKPVKDGIYSFQATPGGSIDLLYAKRQFSAV